MRVIGGLVFWDPGRPVTTSPLRVMAGTAAGAERLETAEQGSVGFFAAGPWDGLAEGDQSWAVTDVDLTNLPELRARAGLQTGGAELVVALYALEGPAFVRRLRGAFAFALWDHRQQSLFLGVDRFGIKRLYYVSDHRRMAFASRPSALLGAAGVAARVDPTQMFNYLNFGFVPAPGSIFAGVWRVPPGHLVSARAGQATIECYWDMHYSERRLRRQEAAAEVFRLTEEAVACALGGTNPKEIGAFLSGGTDSSTVVGLMSRITGGPVSAFSIGFREERYDELGYARLAARHFGAAHYTKVVSPGDALEAMPRLVEAYDEPLGNNSVIGTLFCAQLARQYGATTLLAGDGGDEIFGGNEIYRTDQVFARYHRIPAVLRRGLLEPLLFSLPHGAWIFGRVQRYIRRANLPNPRRFYSYEFFFVQEAARFLGPDFRSAVSVDAPYHVIQEHYDRAQATGDLNRLLYLDLKLTIGDNDLFKVTRTSEMAGVTARLPLLDLPLVEFTGTWPASLKVRGLEKRHLFKRAFRSLLPAEILAKRKHGFGVPTSQWLKEHPGFRALACDTLLSASARQRGYFRAGAVEDLFRHHAEDTTPFYGDILWRMLMLELWHRQHLDGGRGA